MNKKVLAVDDSTSVRKLVELTLKSGGYEAATAPDGLKALEMIASTTFDVVILDINMPRMDGLELLETIRRDPKRGSLPVIMLTTEGHGEERNRAEKLGATRYIVKPFKPAELLAAVRDALK